MSRLLADAVVDVTTLLSGEGGLRSAQGSALTQEADAIRSFRALTAPFVTDAHVDALVELGSAEIKRAQNALESPIERMLLPWLVFQDYGPDLTSPAAVHVLGDRDRPPPHPVIIVPQFPFLRYRLDFAVMLRRFGHSQIVAVECDGAQYHDSVRDFERDSWLEFWGVKTIRGSGAEIHQHPDRIAARVSRYAQHWAASVSEIAP